MNSLHPLISRRGFLRRAVATAALGASLPFRSPSAVPSGAFRNLAGKALVAITLDLEMSRNFPAWDDTHWDFQKGNLDEAAKRYTVGACRRVKERGGVVHCFAVGQVFEQENVDWLKSIVDAGHPLGNHTYDHVRVTASTLEEVQHRFRRAPWLIEDKSVHEVIRRNIHMCSRAIQDRLGIAPVGFRTPGGFGNGMSDRPDIQRMLLDLGFKWMSSVSRGPRVPSAIGERPSAAYVDAIAEAQADTQPFFYESGLLEIPFSPVSDITAFRGRRWKLEYFLDVIRSGLERVIADGAVYDFLAHPSCLGVVDPEYRAIDLICDIVENSGGRAAIVGLDTIARERFGVA